MRRKLIIAALTLAAIALAAGIEHTAYGAETASFLKISPGARPIAMGNAFTAVSDDLNALAWNPAGLASMKKREAAFMHAELFEGTRYDFAGYAHPLGRNTGRGTIRPRYGTIAFGIARLGQDGISGRDENRQETGAFTASDTAFQAAYSRALFRNGPSVGATLKYLQSEIAGTRASGAAFDLGLMHSLKSAPVSLGATISNIGRGMRFADQTNNLPLTASVGAGVRLLSALLISADIRHRPHSGKTTFGLGSEYALLPSLTLRAGYGALFSADAQGPSGISNNPLAGMGMGIGLRIGRATLDYSMAPSGELGTAQRLSIATRF